MANTPGAGTIDPTKSNKRYPIYLGDSILKKDEECQSLYAGVRYNHKPSQTSPSRSTVITPSSAATGLYDLSMTDDDDNDKPSTYEYVGGRISTSSNAYALIYDSAKDGFILDKVDSSFNFNLTSTPWEEDPQKLIQQYPQLSLKDEDPNSGEDSLFSDDDGEFDEDGEPHKKNPYDFRHFLTKRRTSSLEGSVDGTQQEAPASRVTTPNPTLKPSHRPVAKRKPPPKTKNKPAPQSRKPPPSPPRDSSDLSSLGNVSSPEAMMEAVDFEDPEAPDGADDQEQEVKYSGLTIEMDSDDDAQHKRRLGGRSPLFSSGALSARLTSAVPISLSAASSVSPASRRGSPGREGLGISFPKPGYNSSDSESDVDNDENGQEQPAGPAARAADSDVDRDGDVLMLPSPAVLDSHLAYDQASAPTPAPGADEDADGLEDLEAELEQAFESGDMDVEDEGIAGGAPISLNSYAANRPRRAEENESESEEE